MIFRDTARVSSRYSIACAVVVLCLPACMAVFEVQKMGLSVKLPPSARATFDMALANFGEPKYGASMMCVPLLASFAYVCGPVDMCAA